MPRASPSIVRLQQKQRYIDNYYQYEGIRLDPNNIKYNPGMRSLAKLMLNSLWGMVFLSFVTVTHSLAQLVERGTVVKKSCHPTVSGSIPERGIFISTRSLTVISYTT